MLTIKKGLICCKNYRVNIGLESGILTQVLLMKMREKTSEQTQKLGSVTDPVGNAAVGDNCLQTDITKWGKFRGAVGNGCRGGDQLPQNCSGG